MIARISLALAGLGLVAFTLPVTALEPAAPPAEPAALPAAESVSLLYLASHAPQLIRLHLRVGETSLAEVYRQAIGDYFAFLDADGNGKLDADECRFAVSPDNLIAARQNGFLAPYNLSAKPKFEQIDRDKSGDVALTELVDFYRRNGVRLFQPSMFARMDDTRLILDNKLFDLLDQDRDGKITKSEADRAARSLARLDIDEDEMLTSFELLGITPNQFGGLPTTQPGNAHWWIADEATPSASWVKELFSRYDRNRDRKLTIEEVGLPRDEFARLDRNRDQALTEDELAEFANVVTHLELEVQLGGDKEPQGRVEFHSNDPRAKKPDDSARPAAGGVQYQTSSNKMDFVIGASVVNRQTEQQIASALQQFNATAARLQVETLPKDKLDRMSAYYLLSVFDFADRNQDGQLSAEELKQFLSAITKVASAVATFQVESSGTGLFTMLDVNKDSRLDLREQRDVWGKLAPLARDEVIRRIDLPIAWKVSFARGSQSNSYRGNGMMGGPGFGGRDPLNPMPARPKDGPTWFRKMDRNADGFVTLAEFLGPESIFKAIDEDGDGMITPQEAERYSAGSGKPSATP
jgi:Ca2+-binding EF-hand superfamily protein